ncbi:ROK family protein [Gleimia coleocanis DSM 15436]|uniref:ROK family protein n=1 Tax=Gleimia coleocanis DSM 15436 TaxID=525245 RepID=C0VYF7_9ACTO|nr:ROK family transcriptional regulator [Gleimia coleocanis]EEH64460.1 ROK family protein [Gleimia coleocanis DSM 15436]
MPLSNSEQRFIQTLIENGPTYRADLSRILNVSRTTITNLTQTLEAANLVGEDSTATQNLKKPLTLTTELGIIVSLAYHFTKVETTVGTLCGNILYHQLESYPLDLTAQQRLLLGATKIKEALTQLAIPLSKLLGIHLAVDTQSDKTTGKVYSSAASKKWHDVNPKKFFTHTFNVPVYIENTARLQGLAEATWGAGTGSNNVYYVHLSHGVTGAQILNGAIMAGTRGGAGELGHTVYSWSGPLCSCGNRGCLMQYVSIPAIERDASSTLGKSMKYAEFAQHLKDRLPLALDIMERAMQILSQSLVNICHLLDPEVIILGGEIVEIDYPFAEKVELYLRQHALPLSGTQIIIREQQFHGEDVACGKAGITSLRQTEEIIQLALSK